MCKEKAPGGWPSSQLDPGDPVTGNSFISTFLFLAPFLGSFPQVVIDNGQFISYQLNISCGKTGFSFPVV